MQSSHLNGDSLNNFYAVGVDGAPIWQSAEIFRDSIERTSSLGDTCSKFLAIPKFNMDHSHVDWYIPFSPRREDGQYHIVSWNSASDDEKQKALAGLKGLEHKLSTHGQSLLSRNLNPDSTLFAHMLCGNSPGEQLPALHFPGPDYVYIVDGQPVITFWGFLKPGEKVGAQPFASLGTPRHTPPPAGGFTPPPAKRTPFDFNPCWYILPLLLALLLGILWCWLQHIEEDEKKKAQPQQQVQDQGEDYNPYNPIWNEYHQGKGIYATPSGSVPADSVTETDATATDAAVTDALGTDAASDAAGAQDETAGSEAGQDASQDAADGSQGQDQGQDQSQDQDQNQEGSQQQLTPPDLQQDQQGTSGSGTDGSRDSAPSSQEAGPDTTQGNAMDNSLVTNQDASALNGTWNTRSGIMDTNTGKPLNMSYDFKDGQGEVTVTKSDGTKCTGSAGSSFSGSSLNISSGGSVSCTDGSSYNMPDISCTPSSSGKASCSGSYSGGESFPITMYGN